MKKTYKLKDLGCANCAAKMERAISKIKGVNSVNINFMTGKLEIEAADDEFEKIMELSKIKIKKIERQVVIEECL